MNQDTIPSQLAPITIPSTLGGIGASPRKNAAPAGVGAVLKWFLAALVAALVWYVAK